MAVNDIYELNCVYQLGTQSFANVLHYRQTGPDGTGDGRAAVIAAYRADVELAVTGTMSEDVTLLGYFCRRLYPIQSQQFDVAVNAPGTGAADPVAPNIVAVIALYGVMEGRKGVGRLYFTGLPEIRIINGQITTFARDELKQIGDKLILPIVDAGSGFSFQCGIWDQDASVIRDLEKHAVRFRTTNLRSRTLSAV